MTKAEKQVAVRVLKEIAEALLEGAAGPCDYWYKKLAERLTERAINLLKEGT
jgi:hypothetical protein